MCRYLKMYIFIVPARLQVSCNLALGLVFTINILVLYFIQDQDLTLNQDQFCSSLPCAQSYDLLKQRIHYTF